MNPLSSAAGDETPPATSRRAPGRASAAAPRRRRCARWPFDLRLVVQPEAVADQRLAHRVVQPHLLAVVDGRRGPGAAGSAPRPAALTARIAASAWRASSSSVDPCDGASAMPMLQRQDERHRRRCRGARATTASTRRAAASAAGASAWPSSSANWSPPSRAEHVVLAQAAADAARGVEEHAVAGVVAQALVDAPEAVEVDDQQRKAAAAAARVGRRGVDARRPAARGWAGRSARRSSTASRCARAPPAFR